MGKSEGNAFTLATVHERGFTSLSYRYFTYSAHYRQQLNFTWETLAQAEVAYKKLLAYVSEHQGEIDGKIIAEYETEFHTAINDDLNMPKALGVMWTMIRDPKQEPRNIVSTLLQFDKVLGLSLDKTSKPVLDVPPELHDLLDKRNVARVNKDWKLADELRETIESLGYIIKDTDKGSKIVQG